MDSNLLLVPKIQGYGLESRLLVIIPCFLVLGFALAVSTGSSHQYYS